MKNKDLKKFYDKVYTKGERSHYTKLLLVEGDITPDKKAVLGALNWKGKSVLDVGCGTGELTAIIARRNASEVLGIDYSLSAIAEAKKLHARDNLLFECRDIKNVSGRFDVIISLGTLEHFDDPLRLLKKFKQMLLPGGSIIVVSPNWSNPRGYMLMTLKCLFNAKITLADLHYLTPVDFEEWAGALGMKLSWHTVDYDWGAGEKMVGDFRRRIPNILRDSRLPYDNKRIDDFMNWVEKRVIKLECPHKFSGAIGIYHFRNKIKQGLLTRN